MKRSHFYSILFLLVIYPVYKFINSGDKEDITENVSFYKLTPTKYLRLDGETIPPGLIPLDTLSATLTPGEFEPISFLMSCQEKVENINIRFTDLINVDSVKFQGIVDPYIVKIWYQAGITSRDIRYKNSKILTQELLIKNDNLIKINREKEENYLLCRDENGKERYINISANAGRDFSGYTICDSSSLQPFTIDKGTYRQIWLKIYADSNAVPGVYSGKMRIECKDLEYSFPIKIEILQFQLDDPPIIYSLYYTGCLKQNPKPYHYVDKTENQLSIEFKDMLEHGFKYPTVYEKLPMLKKYLKARSAAGLSEQNLFYIDLKLFPEVINSGNKNLISEKIEALNKILNRNNWPNIYLYGIDEADNSIIKKEKPYWRFAKERGAGIFVTADTNVYKYLNNELDIAILPGKPDRKISEEFHKKNIKVFSYHNPQAGRENPEIYRRNYGLNLLFSRYDGAMLYAYQKNYGNFWNDFDDPNQRFREEAFTYPVVNGIISTIQWEGMREGVDDVRYFQTYINLLHSSNPGNGNDNMKLLSKLINIRDLDLVRKEIISRIRELN